MYLFFSRFAVKLLFFNRRNGVRNTIVDFSVVLSRCLYPTYISDSGKEARSLATAVYIWVCVLEFDWISTVNDMMWSGNWFKELSSVLHSARRSSFIPSRDFVAHRLASGNAKND